MLFDCIIIGGGVVGAAVFDRLTKYKLNVLLLEKGDDVATFASRANSGIVHAGYDCKPGTLKAKFNVLGNKLIWNDVEELNVPHLKCGSIVVASKDQYQNLIDLQSKAKLNGVVVQLLDRLQTLKFESNVSDNIHYSLYAPCAGVISPYQLTIAYIDRGILNGGIVKLNSEVIDLNKQNDIFVVKTKDNNYEGKIVINCSGYSGSKINDLISAEHFNTTFRRGDYFVLDNTERKNIRTVIFPTPTKAGKGILVAPTADGNIIYGPTAIDQDSIDCSSSLDSLETIKESIPLTYKNPAFNKCIRVYSGVRTIIDNDFIVQESSLIKNFYMAIGICSPGLTSSPAIAEYLKDLIVDKLTAIKKDKFISKMNKKPRLNELKPEEINSLVEKDSSWGRIVCRCEKVTEAEIVQAIHSPLPATTVDAIKRRTRAGMGRCQGGFCSLKVMEIISRELNIPLNLVDKGNGFDSNIAVCKEKEVNND